MENGRGLGMSEKEGSWRKYLPHSKVEEDFDRETASDMIGFLLLVVLFETGIIIGLLLYIYFVLI